MKNKLILLFVSIFVVQAYAFLQPQWYQNQDGNSAYPNGTYATGIQPLTHTSFVSCFLWNVNNDIITWKVSKSDYNGQEVKTVYFSGEYSGMEMRTGKKHVVYLLEKVFPPGTPALYKLYKLDSNLNITIEKTIEFPGSFEITGLHQFKLDGSDNVYISGDGQFPENGGYTPVSFVSKSGRNLNTNWTRFDTTLTSFNNLHMGENGKVYIIADHYTTFPDVKLYTYRYDGRPLPQKTITLSPDRLNLSTRLLDDNLYLYGMQSAPDYEQSIYLSRYSVRYSAMVYSKTFYKAPGSALIDMKPDHNNNLLMLSAQYYNNGEIRNRISSVHGGMGFIRWQRSYLFANDSCNFNRIVTTPGSSRFYIIGEKRAYNNNYTKGVAVRLTRRHGISERRFIGPDSVSFLRSHWLLDGITDTQGELVSIGNTQDYDTTTYSGTYFRSFAAKFGGRNTECGNNTDNGITDMEDAVAEDMIITTPSVKIFPNPATTQVTVSNINADNWHTLAVYSGNGSLLMQQAISSSTITINTSKFSAGNYFILLRSDKSPADNKKIQFAVSK